MNKSKLNNIIEYLCLTMILSYFFAHNLFLVLVGIILSLYLINKSFINSFIRSINKKILVITGNHVLNKNLMAYKYDSVNKKSTKKDSKLSLVETVEELGFIPKMDKTKDKDAA